MYRVIVNSLVKIFNEDAYLNKVVSAELEKNNFSELERRLYTKITYGVVENKILLDYYLQPFIAGKRVKPFIKNVLRVGAYVINNMDMANYYIVSALVDLVKKDDLRSSKFVNGVLRNFERNPRRSLDDLSRKDYLSIRYSMPIEIVEILIKDYGIEKAETILKSYLNNPKTNTYRINLLVASSIEKIKEEITKIDENIVIDGDMIYTKKSLINHTLFKNGSIIAQDYSSSLSARYLEPQPGDYVLDACSAPGMKTIQMASMMRNEGKIIALDIYQHKLNLINENAKNYKATIIETKLGDGSKITFDEKFDKILVDVPCSGLGVISHKPDLKYHMTKNKINELSTISYDILNNVSRFLKVNGTIVFSTCTITKKENEHVIKKFIQSHPNYSVVEEEKIIPQEINSWMIQDGFYICKLVRKEEENE